jgi:hypothetical protein
MQQRHRSLCFSFASAGGVVAELGSTISEPKAGVSNRSDVLPPLAQGR